MPSSEGAGVFRPLNKRLLIRPKRNVSLRRCHPERSAAKSRDLRLFFAALVEMLKGSINSRKGVYRLWKNSQKRRQAVQPGTSFTSVRA
jgi:hypothetical protein